MSGNCTWIKMRGFIAVLLFAALFCPDFLSAEPTSEDLYNTRTITSDLKWTASPPYNGWEEVSGIDETTRTTIRFYQVCNRDDPNTDNWVRTRYIRSRGAQRAYIDVEFSMMKCDSDKTTNCKETFNLYYYESDRDIASSTFPPWRERKPYVKIDTIAAGTRFSQGDRNSAVNKKTWTLGPLSRRGFYIAAHDKGACMSLLTLRVYYYYCPETTIALATFPRTVAGKDATSLVTVNGKCVNNSRIASENGPRYHCNSNGEWQINTGECECLAGYQASEKLLSCNACDDGKYKAGHGNHECAECPRNSYSSSAGTPNVASYRGLSASVSRINRPTLAPDFCRCLPGYYRAENENVHQPCTKPPSGPANIKFVVHETSAVIEWDTPTDLGDRKDVYYNVSCEKCESDSYDSCNSCGHQVTYEPSNVERMTDNRVVVNKLFSYTYYQFKIFALNGVSSVSTSLAKYALVRIMTNQAAPSTVTNVRAVEKSTRSFTLAWSMPKQPNGKVLGYEVRVQQLNIQSATLKTEMRDFLVEPHHPVTYETGNRSLSVHELKPGSSYRVQVRARTAAGYGEYSDALMANTEEEVLTSVGSDTSTLGIAIGGGAGFVIVSSIILGIYFALRRRKRATSQPFGDDTSSEDKGSFEDARQLVVRLPSTSSAHRLYVDYSDPHKGVREFACEIDASLVQIEETIGQGEFGEVFRGKLLDPTTDDEQVAIKRLKQGASVKDQLNFLREACTMAQFDDPNVLILKGVVTKTRPMMIVSEFMENGSLNSFLKRHQGELSILQLTNMLRGIANGMKYLSEMQFVHRDLAARNILVNSDLVCKVSDFGLSRTLENDPHATYTTQGGKIALRWTAPECIRLREFTSASDVWSYGIVMWEVMSYGEKPYWDMTNQDVLESIDEGYRLPAPYECPNVLHKIMIECWALDAKQRPTFEQLVNRLQDIMTSPSFLKTSSPVPTESELRPNEEE